MAEVLDALILAWLIGTWFYEGHHRRCRVEIVCPTCGHKHDESCSADHRPEKP